MNSRIQKENMAVENDNIKYMVCFQSYKWKEKNANKCTGILFDFYYLTVIIGDQ